MAARDWAGGGGRGVLAHHCTSVFFILLLCTSPFHFQRLRGLYSQSTYICRVQGCVLRLPKNLPPTPSPPSECVLPPPPPPPPKDTHRAVRGVGGSIFWKTPDIGLASYSIISLRLYCIKSIRWSRTFKTRWATSRGYISHRCMQIVQSVLLGGGGVVNRVCPIDT
jgi:hypothetical protein